MKSCMETPCVQDVLVCRPLNRVELLTFGLISSISCCKLSPVYTNIACLCVCALWCSYSSAHFKTVFNASHFESGIAQGNCTVMTAMCIMVLNPPHMQEMVLQEYQYIMERS